MRLKAWALRVLKTKNRRYRVQQNGLGEYRVQCNDTGTPWGWQTMGRRDGRNQWNMFLTDNPEEIADFIAEKEDERREVELQNQWTTTGSGGL